MPMKNPPHPGTVVFGECIEPLGLTITHAARALGVTRTTLSELVNGKRGISPEMAIRLSQVFGGSAESWLVQQALARELSEELGIQAAIGKPVTRIRHNYRHGGAVHLQFFAVHEFTGEIDNQIYEQVRWVRIEDLTAYEFLAADRGLIRDLAAGKLL